MTILFLPATSAYGEREMLWPWEQDADIRHRLNVHTAACSRCTLAVSSVFGAATAKADFRPGCIEGVELAHALRDHAVVKRASGQPA